MNGLTAAERDLLKATEEYRASAFNKMPHSEQLDLLWRIMHRERRQIGGMRYIIAVVCWIDRWPSRSWISIGNEDRRRYPNCRSGRFSWRPP